MKFAVLQHVGHEGPGTLDDWASSRGHTLEVRHPYRGDALPALDEIDALCLLGGPMSVLDPLPWLEAERELIREAVEQRVPVLGICLGAQQIAVALGGRVERAPYPEVGWFPLTAAGDGLEQLPETGAEFVGFHWHCDQFELPAGATLLARSEACVNQAFASGSALGMQFHLEVTPAWLLELTRFAEPVAPGPFVQPPESLIDPSRCAAANTILSRLLDSWLGRPGVRLAGKRRARR